MGDHNLTESDLRGTGSLKRTATHQLYMKARTSSPSRLHHITRARQLPKVLTLITLAALWLKLATELMAQTGPFAVTQPATFVSGTNATLEGMAVPNGLPAVAWFEWGAQGGYDQQTTPVDIGSGVGVVRVSTAIGGLTNYGIYQYRLVVSNSVAVTRGFIQLVTTGRKIVGWSSSTGQLGIQPQPLSNAVAVSDGETSGLVLTSDNGVVLSLNTPVQPILTNAISASTSESFSLAILTDGTLEAWGDNSRGQTNFPPGLTNMALAYAGPWYGLALGSDGSLSGWGEWTDFVPNTPVSVPAGLTNVVGITGGKGHCVALKADGTVQAWGDGYYGQLNVPTGLTNVVAVAAGWYFSLALKADGTVIRWPGYGGSPPAWAPAVTVASNAIAISAAYTGATILHNDFTVTGLDGLSNVPPGLSNVVCIGSGYYGAYAVGPELAPLAQNESFSGSINSTISVTLNAPDPNGDVVTFRVVSLPQAGTLYQYLAGSPGDAITATNTVVIDGGGRLYFIPVTNNFGSPYATFNFVANDGELDSLPATVTLNVAGSPYAFTQPASFLDANDAILNGMAVPNLLPTSAWFEWGTNGLFDHTTRVQAVGSGTAVIHVTDPVSNLAAGVVYQSRLVVSNMASITYGAPRFFGFHDRGKAVAWGDNYYGQTDLPSGLTNVVSLASGGGGHSLALTAEGTVLAWGENIYGQTNVPQGLGNVIAIGAGDNHSLAVKADGTVVAWGWNNYGETNVPAGLSNVVAVAGGGDQSLALRSDGTVVAWGANDYGQATVPTGLSNVVAIAGGLHHSAALLANGTVVGWGDTYPTPGAAWPGLTNAISLASAGGDHDVALRSNGTVAVWGKNTHGVTNVPPGLTNIILIAAGANNVYALGTNGTVTIWGDILFGERSVPAGLTNVVALSGGQYHVVAMADNLRPTAVAGNLSGYPNHDLVLLLQGVDPNGDPLSFLITSLPSAGALYQFSSGSRGSMITATNTIVSDAGNHVVFAPAANGLGTPYANFTYVANDGETNSAPATLTVNLMLPPAPQFGAAGALWSPGAGLQLNFTGNSNATYRLWASTNLVSWLPIGTAIGLGNGLFQYVDADATNFPQRFYRAGAP